MGSELKYFQDTGANKRVFVGKCLAEEIRANGEEIIDYVNEIKRYYSSSSKANQKLDEFVKSLNSVGNFFIAISDNILKNVKPKNDNWKEELTSYAVSAYRQVETLLRKYDDEDLIDYDELYTDLYETLKQEGKYLAERIEHFLDIRPFYTVDRNKFYPGIQENYIRLADFDETKTPFLTVTYFNGFLDRDNKVVVKEVIGFREYIDIKEIEKNL